MNISRPMPAPAIAPGPRPQEGCGQTFRQFIAIVLMGKLFGGFSQYMGPVWIYPFAEQHADQLPYPLRLASPRETARRRIISASPTCIDGLPARYAASPANAGCAPIAARRVRARWSRVSGVPAWRWMVAI